MKKIKKREPFYPKGTDLKKLANHLKAECKKRKENKEWQKNNLITTEQYFNRIKRDDYRN
tara:strand:+ start:50 stop:229 length:180 start_codon:yes stop_codon:yes gene_type:complete